MDLRKAEVVAVRAARAAGELMRQHLASPKRANVVTQHDIKLELDVRCQNLIERKLARAIPKAAFLGEEGVSGKSDADWRWVVDPIDGTVNFAYGIPHACVSIALQQRDTPPPHSARSARTKVAAGRSPRNLAAIPPLPGGEGRGEGNLLSHPSYSTVLGLVYDPFCNELWTATRGGPARLNGKIIHVSRRSKLSEAIIAIGFAKSAQSLRVTLPYFNQLVPRVRKIRMMGAAALALTYVATGRFDGYVERGIRLWDIAAGGLIVECAGGEFWHEPIDGQHAYRMIASNGLLRRRLRVP